MINRQAKVTAICSLLNLMPYEVTAVQEWAYVYNVFIAGKGWRFVSKKKVDTLLPGVSAPVITGDWVTPAAPNGFNCTHAFIVPTPAKRKANNHQRNLYTYHG